MKNKHEDQMNQQQNFMNVLIVEISLEHELFL